jgi:hypothetical protein
VKEPEMADRETIIEAGDGGAAATIAAVSFVALLVVGTLYYLSLGGSSSRTIDIDVPNITASATPGER